MGNLFGDILNGIGFNTLTGQSQAEAAANATTGAANTAADAARAASADSLKAQEEALALQTNIYNNQITREQPFYATGVEGNALLRSAVTGQPTKYYIPAPNTIGINTPATYYGATPSPKYGGLSATQILGMVAGNAPNPNNYTLADAVAAGKEATAQLTASGQPADALPGGTTGTADFQATESPAAKYQEMMGSRSLQRQLAARGLLGSGNAAQRLGELSSGIAANDWNQQYSRILDMVKVGTGASASAGAASNTLSGQIGQNANTVAGINSNTATNVGNAALAAGAGRAGLYAGQAGLPMNMLNTGVNVFNAGKAAGYWGGASPATTQLGTITGGGMQAETGAGMADAASLAF